MDPRTDTSIDDIARAAAILRRGGLVAFPTETVYGLGADASNATAVARIFAAKGRPADHPLIVHLAEASQLDEWAVQIPDEARILAAAFWPGALTMILHRAEGVPDVTTGGRPTVGLRVPDQPLALALLRAFGGGIAAPSANRFGRVSPTRADDVRAELGEQVDMVLDGGPCRVGVESTIIDLTRRPFEILRPGGISAEAIEHRLGHSVERTVSGAARAPGMLEVHYAPRVPVQLVDTPTEAAARLRPGLRVGFIGPIEATPPEGVDVVGRAIDAAAYAHHLYQWLREADERGLDLLLAIPPTEVGVGTAVRDRLRRAAAAAESEAGEALGGRAIPPVGDSRRETASGGAL